MRNLKKQNQRGIIIDYVLVFGLIFLMLLSALFGFILLQLRQSNLRASNSQALDAAEAGLNYYLWCLNNDVQSNCVGSKDYTDNEGNSIGKFQISADVTTSCGQAILYTITSRGWTNQFPSVVHAVKALYGRRSVAAYSGIINAGVWFGNNETLNGPFMANGGVRMDGPNSSLVSSATMLNGNAEWVCNTTYGCSPCPVAAGQCRVSGSQCICPGVFTTTANSNSSLFKFPVPSFDFNSITIDLANIKAAAQSSGIYLPPSTSIPGYQSNGKGYDLEFQSNGTVKVYVITALISTKGYNEGIGGTRNDAFTISAESLYGTYTIPVNCSAIYAEDDVWPRGVIKGKVTLASANLINGNGNTDAVLAANITYAANDGTNGFSLVSQGSVYLGPQSPNNMELHGIYVAQNGTFERDNYNYSGNPHYNNGCTYYGDVCNSFVLYGSYISNGRPNETWVDAGNNVTSGYRNTAVYYDTKLIYNPSPFVAPIDSNFKIVSWQEIN